MENSAPRKTDWLSVAQLVISALGVAGMLLTAGALLVFGLVMGVTDSSQPGDLHTARLALCQATRQVIANGLTILGVGAPERM